MTCKDHSLFLTITNGIMANNNDTTSRIHVHTNVYRIKLIMLNKLETVGVLTLNHLSDHITREMIIKYDMVHVKFSCN